MRRVPCVRWRWGGERLEKKGRGKRAERGETKGLDREKIEQRDTEVKTINCSDIIEHTVTNDLYVILLIQWKMMVIITMILLLYEQANDWTLGKYNSETVGVGLSDKVNKVLKEFRRSQSANNGAVSFPFERMSA